MHIGISAPASLGLLQDLVAEKMPEGYAFPQTSLLAREFLARGHTVSLYTLSRNLAKPMSFEGERIRVHVGRYRDEHRARDAFATEISDVRNAILADPPEVVSAHWTYEFAIAALSTQLRTFITVRDWPPAVLRYYPSGYRLVRMFMAIRVFADRRASFISLSPYIATLVSRWTRRNSVIIPNGMERSAFEREPLPFDQRTRTIVCIANGFGRRKNVSALLHAMREVRHSFPEHRLALIGDQYGPDGDAKSWAAERNLIDGVDFVGSLPYREAQDVLAQAQLLAHPSLEESFGRTLIEAGAYGTPALGGRGSGAVPWVLDEGSAGILVDVQSPQDIARGIREAIERRDRWTELSAQGRANAFERFSIQHVADRYLQTLGATG